MESSLPYSRPLYGLLAAFAFTAAASIALENILGWTFVALLLFSHFKSGRRIDWPKGLFPAATLLFLATFLTGALGGVNPANSFHTVYKYLAFLLLFFIAAPPLSTGERGKLMRAFAYGAAFCALFGIGKHLFLRQERIDSFSGDKMVFGGMLMAALLVQLHLLIRRPREPLHWTSLLLIAPALLLTETRGAWVGAAAGLFLYLALFRRKWLVPCAVGMVAVFFILPAHYQERVRAIWNFHLVYDNQERIYMWEAGWHISRDHPLWGIGQGNLTDVYHGYKLPQAVEKDIPHLHNNFVQILVQNGWVGLLAYLLWIAAYYAACLGFKPLDAESAGWNGVLACVFTAVWVWGLTEYTFSHQFMNLQAFFLGIQAGLWKTPRRPVKSAAAPPSP
jgi:O-antigen ligase